jgi:hypothetical protein
MWAWKVWYGYIIYDLPILLLSSGDSVEMSHKATMPFVKLPAIILWNTYRTFQYIRNKPGCAGHAVQIVN